MKHVHVKDIGFAPPQPGHEHGTPHGVGIGLGRVDLKGCIAVLKEAGFDGVLMGEAGAEDIEASYKNMRALVEG